LKLENNLKHRNILLIKDILESETVLKTLGDKLNLMKVYYNLAICHTNTNHKEKAAHYYEKAEKLKKTAWDFLIQIRIHHHSDSWHKDHSKYALNYSIKNTNNTTWKTC
jgi:hypothetical protein